MKITDQVGIKSYRTRLMIEVLAVLLLCCFPLFYRLDALVIRQWDEARNAVSALEMSQNKNYIVRYFNGQPDYWDVKPPLLIWLQVLSVRLLGANELAIRIPSAIAALLTMVFLIGFFHRYHNNRYAGYLSSLILATSQGYVNQHIARTGDHDALLILFTTIVIFLYYEFLTAPMAKNKLLWVITAALILGVFTKSIAILMIMPGLLIMTFVLRAQQRVFANKWFYCCLAAFVLICGSYYALRDSMQTGYLKAVWTGELFPRYLNTYDDFNKESFWYYARNLFIERYAYWIFTFLPALFIVLFHRATALRRFQLYLLINIFAFLLVISSGTHNLWYDGPLFPMLAVISALFLLFIFKHLRGLINRTSSSVFQPLPTLLLVMLFLYPGYSIMKKVKRTNEFNWDEGIYSMSYLLRDLPHFPAIKEEPFSIVFDGYYGHLLFYTKVIACHTGNEIKIKPYNLLKPGDLVMISQESKASQVKSQFIFQSVYSNNRVELLKINGIAP